MKINKILNNSHLFVCRACIIDLTNTEMKKYDIFETQYLNEKFIKCTSIQIEKDNKYPQQLCDNCLNKINSFYEFQLMCIKSNKIFQETIKSQDEHLIDDLLVETLPTIASNITIDEEKLNIPAQMKSNDINDEIDINCKENPIDIKDIANILYEYVDVPETNKQITEESIIFSNDNVKRNISKANINKIITPLKSSNYRKTIKSSKNLLLYSCRYDGCDEKFRHNRLLNAHLRKHEDKNGYRCEEAGCNRIYKHKPTLNMHMRKAHKLGPEIKKHICEICGKLFKTSSILNYHSFTHKDKSAFPFVCTETNCNRRFPRREKLKIHLLRHAGVKNFVCTVCGMRKTTQGELKIHMNYHTLERTWPCQYCTHICNSSGNLRMHIRTVHERAKDYACQYCERTFAKPDTRKYHEMTHTGEKPHECMECGKKFTQPAALRTHKKIHQRQNIEKSIKISSLTSLSSDAVNNGNDKDVDGVVNESNLQNLLEQIDNHT